MHLLFLNPTESSISSQSSAGQALTAWLTKSRLSAVSPAKGCERPEYRSTGSGRLALAAGHWQLGRRNDFSSVLLRGKVWLTKFTAGNTGRLLVQHCTTRSRLSNSSSARGLHQQDVVIDSNLRTVFKTHTASYRDTWKPKKNPRLSLSFNHHRRPTFYGVHRHGINS